VKLSERPYLRSVALKPDATRDSMRYPFCIPAVRKLETLNLHRDVTFLAGENGTGKSTLLEAIAIAWGFNAEGGSRNFHFSTRSSHSELYQHLRLVKSHKRPRDGYFLRAESFFNVATHIEELDKEPGGPKIIDGYGSHSLHEQSHGESFFALMHKRMRGNGLYILDEPEAALSPMRQLQMLSRLHELVRLQSQFVIATHSPILLAYPQARILVLDENGYAETSYRETEHFRITRRFFDNPEGTLAQYLGEKLC
jgi:predicted ATPase